METVFRRYFIVSLDKTVSVPNLYKQKDSHSSYQMTLLRVALPECKMQQNLKGQLILLFQTNMSGNCDENCSLEKSPGAHGFRTRIVFISTI